MWNNVRKDSMKDAGKLIFVFLVVMALLFLSLNFFTTKNEKGAGEVRAESHDAEVQMGDLFDVIMEHGNVSIAVFRPTGVLYVSSRGSVMLLVNADGTPYTVIQLEEDMGRGNLDE